MPTFSVDTTTPNYVLMNEGHRIGPKLVPNASKKCHVIYGFSNKAAYESFRANSELDLTPYPLVKGYLLNQIEEAKEEHKMVVIDANGPCAPTLAATKMASVLHAQENRIDHLPAVYMLTLDEDANAYQFAEVSETP